MLQSFSTNAAPVSHVSHLGRSLLICTNLDVWDSKRALEIGEGRAPYPPPPSHHVSLLSGILPTLFRKSFLNRISSGLCQRRPRKLPANRDFTQECRF